MQRITLSPQLSVSPIVHGHWRLAEWGYTGQELLQFLEQTIECGITSYDHADIYGDYTCEKIFGEALALKKSLRSDIQLITKCGINLISDKFPHRKVKHYDYSAEHILSSVDQSLKNLHTDYIDLLLLHRPSPFFRVQEVARAFHDLKKSGKVLEFGVSNFNPYQYELLDTSLDGQLVTNQIEISPFCLDSFQDGNIDFLQRKAIRPMAWSPLAGGQIFSPTTDRGHRLLDCLQRIAGELDQESIDTVIYRWLLMHPSGIIPIAGTGKIDRLRKATAAYDVNLSLEQWFEIYTASLGHEVP